MAAQTEDGVIRDVPDAALERWAAWPGKPGRLAAAIRKHIQHPETGELGEWRETMGQLAARRAADRERKASAEGNGNDRPLRKFRGTSAESHPNSAATGRNGTGRNVSISSDSVSMTAEGAETEGMFVTTFYSRATEERKADVRAQIRATLSDRGAQIRRGEYAHAVDERHLRRSMATIIRNPPKEANVAIQWLLREIENSRLEYQAEQHREPTRAQTLQSPVAQPPSRIDQLIAQ